HLADSLSFSGRKVVAAWAAVPFPALRGCSLPDSLSAFQHQVPWQPLSSCREQEGSCCFAQSVVLRGISKGHLRCPAKQPSSALHAWESSEQVLQHYLHTLFPGALSTCHLLEQPCSTPPPYPQFFSPLLSREGFLLDQPPGSSSAGAVESIPVLAALQASPALHRLLCSLPQQLGSLRLRSFPSFFSAGVEEEDFQEALESLRTLAQCYQLGSGAEEEADSD
ncbi:MSTO1 protein, partial [Bucco capensis]|nr:MSTO1 protein [Bucco capensis]